MFHLIDLAAVAAVAIWAYKNKASLESRVKTLEASAEAKLKAAVSPAVSSVVAAVEADVKKAL